MDGDEHEQWPKDVIVFINVKRIGMWCDDEGQVCFNELRRSESFNNWSFASNIET